MNWVSVPVGAALFFTSGSSRVTQLQPSPSPAPLWPVLEAPGQGNPSCDPEIFQGKDSQRAKGWCEELFLLGVEG